MSPRSRRLRTAGMLMLLAACSNETPTPRAAPPPPRLTPSTEPARTDPIRDPMAAEVEALPDWSASVELEPMRPDQQPSTVPQLRDAGRYLDALRNVRRDSVRGVLLCRVMVSRDREWDSSGLFNRNTAPDTSVYVRIGGGTEVRARLAEDAYEGVLSVPSVELRASTPLSIRLVDRDVSIDDPIATFDLTWPLETPVVQAVGPATLRCGVLDEETVRPRATNALAAANRLLDAATRGRTRVDLLRDQLESKELRSRPLHGAIREAASFLGYAHPDVGAALARLGTLEAMRGAAHHEAVVTAHTGAPSVGTDVRVSRDVRATVRGFECGVASARDPRAVCTLRIDANYARIPAAPGFVSPIEATLLLAAEAPVRCPLTSNGGDAFVRTMGASSHVFECRVEAPPDESTPVLVRVDAGQSRALLRVR